MSEFDYSRTPVNREAASVTSQSGCASDDTLTDEQKRENLVAKVKVLADEVLRYPKKSKERKALNIEKTKICLEINALRPKRKIHGLSDYIVEVVKSEVSDFQFRRIIKKASENYKEALNKPNLKSEL